MSIADQLQSHATRVLFAVDSDEYGIVSGDHAGERFHAHAQVASEIAIDSVLGEDMREVTTLYCFRPGPNLESQTRIRGRGVQWDVIKRHDNPVEDMIRFEVKHAVSGKDS